MAAHEFGYADMPTSRGRSFVCVSWSSGLPCGRFGRLASRKRRPLRLGMVVSDTLAGYMSNKLNLKKSDVNVRS